MTGSTAPLLNAEVMDKGHATGTFAGCQERILACFSSLLFIIIFVESISTNAAKYILSFQWNGDWWYQSIVVVG
jgi:hypothetical protein